MSKEPKVHYAPLPDFPWDGEEFDFSPDVRFVRVDKITEPILSRFKFSTREQKLLNNSSYWLEFQSDEDPRDVVVLILLSLWLVMPMHLRAPFCFTAPFGDEDLVRSLPHIFWGSTDGQIFDEESLLLAKKQFSSLKIVYANQQRLNDALQLTFHGCWAEHWQVALISHAAALEAILTYSEKRGLTDRLCKAYASLVKDDESERITAYEEFSTSYEIRHDAVHGRAYKISSDLRVGKLKKLQDLLRQLWQVILSSQPCIEILEKDDGEREVFFAEKTNGIAWPEKSHSGKSKQCAPHPTKKISK